MDETAWRPHDAESVFDPWESYIVPDFPLEILPAVTQRYVVEQSRVIAAMRPPWQWRVWLALAARSITVSRSR